MSQTLAIAAAVLVTVSAASAHAEPHRVQVVSKTVSYGADVATPQGAARFLQQIERTAHDLCRPTASPFDHTTIDQRRACEGKAIGQAVAQLNVPQVTAAYESAQKAQLAAR